MPLVKEALQKGAELLAKGLSDDTEAGLKAAEAIMTTDTVSKQFAVMAEVGGRTFYVGGMSKGSGMIHPNMATMLSVTTTDVSIARFAAGNRK